MILRIVYILCVTVFILVFTSGCAVNEFPDSLSAPEGSIHVFAEDEDGNFIEQASILIDGIERPEKTTAYIHGIVEGFHDVVLEKFGFWSDSLTVKIIGGDTITVRRQLKSIPDSMTGFLTVDSNPLGARLIVNGRTFLVDGESITTPVTVELPWSKYNISVQKSGFATVNPLLPEVTISAGDTTIVSFTLESVEVGRVAGALPFDFTLENEVTDSIRLTDLTGQVVLINFWYADCVPCMREFPDIEAVYREYASRGFHVLAVNPMYPDDKDVVIQVREQLGLTFQLLLDWDRPVTSLYRVSVFPRNILVDRTGRIREVFLGVDEENLSAMVESLIATGE